MGIDKEFEKLVLRLNKKNDSEVFSFEYKEKKYWLKKARGTKSQFSHKIFYKIFPFEVLIPVEEKSAKDALTFETEKIERFQRKGIQTPNIPFKNSEFFVLEDMGKTVHSYIREKDISKEKMYYYIEKVLIKLSKIHNLNDFHGGAQARNFIYKDGEISVIDFEDSFSKDINLDVLQFRDLILFLLSLTKTRASFEIDYEYVINKYIELSPSNKSFKQKLKSLALRLSFLIKISQIKFVNNFIGRDGQGFFKLFVYLEKLKG